MQNSEETLSKGRKVEVGLPQRVRVKLQCGLESKMFNQNLKDKAVIWSRMHEDSLSSRGQDPDKKNKESEQSLYCVIPLPQPGSFYILHVEKASILRLFKLLPSMLLCLVCLENSYSLVQRQRVKTGAPIACCRQV